MKKLYLIILLLIMMNKYVPAYDQDTHVKITKESYQLLKINLGMDIPIIYSFL
ncbi:hypothetical protein MNBD_IGNAVI01-1580 [hydrothermal vent metagenome]|uniref:Uncharacterized protein n=1 Tax=hydrothermal vent metagenome TaxID=652676 RepID=A0A3B1CUG7_9ZZZZ